MEFPGRFLTTSGLRLASTDTDPTPIPDETKEPLTNMTTDETTTLEAPEKPAEKEPAADSAPDSNENEEVKKAATG